VPPARRDSGTLPAPPAAMPPEPEHPPEPAPPPGVTRNLRDFLQARWDLLGLETREAAGILTSRLIILLLAAAALVAAWVLLLVAAWGVLRIVLAARLSGDLAPWAGPLAAALLFLIHLAAGLVLLARARRRSAPPLFECTRAEWKKDQEWLHKERSRNGSGS
jgi:uncharacterized membrane protein YqjE